MLLSDRINNLSESQTILMARLSRELKSEGIDIIDLSLGQPDFQTPDFIKDAAKKALDDGYTFYTPVPGFPELREAISNKFKNENRIRYAPDQIVVSTGAKQSLANVCLSILNPGDEVILPAPYWVSYKEMIKLADGIPVSIPSTVESDFKITPEQLKDHITDKTRLFCFSSPCNPTGSVYTKNELKAFAEVIAEHKDIMIISDEIYEYINFTDEHTSIAQFDFIKDRVITVNGVSKGFAMTGWRIGYLGAPQWLAAACSKMQGQITSGACAIAQRAAITAINAGREATLDMKNTYKKRRDLVLNKLKDMPLLKNNTPKGAFYIFIDVSSYFGKSYGDYIITKNSDLCMYLLKNAHVALVTGKAFGDDNCLRISYAASEEDLSNAMDRIKGALEKLS